MAKKTKTTTIVEEDPQELDYKKDLENKSMLEVALDTPEEKPKGVKEESEAEPKGVKVDDDTEEIEFDPAAFKKEVAEETRKELLESLQPTQKEEKDAYIDYQEKFFKDNSRQPTWFEVAKFMEEQALTRLEAKQTEKVKEQEELTTKQQKALEEQTKETNKYVDETLNELYEDEKLPQIKNKEDKDDYGLRVKNALMTTIVDVNTKRIAENKRPKTIKEIFYEDFEMPRSEVAGADAPVNMGRGGYTPDEGQELDYQRDIAGKRNSFRNIISRAVRGR